MNTELIKPKIVEIDPVFNQSSRLHPLTRVEIVRRGVSVTGDDRILQMFPDFTEAVAKGAIVCSATGAYSSPYAMEDLLNIGLDDFSLAELVYKQRRIKYYSSDIRPFFLFEGGYYIDTSGNVEWSIGDFFKNSENNDLVVEKRRIIKANPEFSVQHQDIDENINLVLALRLVSGIDDIWTLDDLMNFVQSNGLNIELDLLSGGFTMLTREGFKPILQRFGIQEEDFNTLYANACHWIREISQSEHVKQFYSPFRGLSSEFFGYSSLEAIPGMLFVYMEFMEKLFVTEQPLDFNVDKFILSTKLFKDYLVACFRDYLLKNSEYASKVINVQDILNSDLVRSVESANPDAYSKFVSYQEVAAEIFAIIDQLNTRIALKNLKSDQDEPQDYSYPHSMQRMQEELARVGRGGKRIFKKGLVTRVAKGKI